MRQTGPPPASPTSSVHCQSDVVQVHQKATGYVSDPQSSKGLCVPTALSVIVGLLYAGQPTPSAPATMGTQ
jgi:hypothetical protein